MPMNMQKKKVMSKLDTADSNTKSKRHKAYKEAE